MTRDVIAAAHALRHADAEVVLSGETLQKDDNCRAYRSEFYEAAVTRQNVTWRIPVA